MNVQKHSTASPPPAIWVKLDDVMTAIFDGEAFVEALSLMIPSLPKEHRDAFYAVSGRAVDRLTDAREFLDAVMEQVKKTEVEQ